MTRIIRKMSLIIIPLLLLQLFSLECLAEVPSPDVVSSQESSGQKESASGITENTSSESTSEIKSAINTNEPIIPTSIITKPNAEVIPVDFFKGKGFASLSTHRGIEIKGGVGHFIELGIENALCVKEEEGKNDIGSNAKINFLKAFDNKLLLSIGYQRNIGIDGYEGWIESYYIVSDLDLSDKKFTFGLNTLEKGSQSVTRPYCGFRFDLSKTMFFVAEFKYSNFLNWRWSSASIGVFLFPVLNISREENLDISYPNLNLGIIKKVNFGFVEAGIFLFPSIIQVYAGISKAGEIEIVKHKN